MQLHKLFPITLIVITRLATAGPVDVDQVTLASYAGDTPALESLLQEVDGVSYASAYLKYRLAIAYFGEGKSEQSDDLLENTIADLDQVLTRTADSAEALALKSTAIGMRISFSPAIRGMSMGAASNRAIDRALELDPENPRAWMIKGIAAHNTPALFGGGTAKALVALDKAISFFDDANTGWGHADAYVWRGLTYKDEGDLPKARSDFQAALTIAPNFAWARRLLDALDNPNLAL